MGQRGRPPNSVRLQLIKGKHVSTDDLKGKQDIEPPAVPALPPNPPRWLHKYAKEEWRRTVKELRRRSWLATLDEALFAAYCQSYARWRECEDSIDKDGYMLRVGGDDEKGQAWHKVNPCCALALKFGSEMRRTAEQFGITPGGRKGWTEPKKNETAQDRLNAAIGD